MYQERRKLQRLCLLLLLVGCRQAPSDVGAPGEDANASVGETDLGSTGQDGAGDTAAAFDGSLGDSAGMPPLAWWLPAASVTCGGVCSNGTACVAGACKSVTCVPTLPAGPMHVMRVQTWDISSPGCDLDGDGSLDNGNWGNVGAFSAASRWNQPIDVSDDGMAILVVGTGVGPVTLIPVTGEVLPSGAFAISADSVDTAAGSGQCPFREAWPATLDASGNITAQGSIASAWSLFPLVPHLSEGTVPVAGFSLDLALATDATGAATGLSGTLCGAYAQKAAVDRSVAFVAALVANDPLLAGWDDPAVIGKLHVADIDTDADGKLDAVSFGHAFVASPISTVGFQ